MSQLKGKRIAFLVAQEGVEQIELTEPWKAVENAGGEPVLLAPQTGEVQAFNHLDKGEKFQADKAVADCSATDYDGLVLPGGVANPDQLRLDEGAVGFIRKTFAAGIPCAAICHAPWALIEAGVVEGRHLTSWPSLRTDLTNAGANWADEQVQVCEMAEAPNVLITSRKPDDLAVFCETFVEIFARDPEASAVDIRGSKVTTAD